MSKKEDIVIDQYLSVPQNTTRKDIEFYSTGVTLLDLCLGGGWGKGFISNVVGGESAGKTLLACETIAKNFAKDKKFKHKIDNAESGFTLNTKYLWNFDVDLISPQSKLIEHFEYNLEKVISKLKDDIDYIYVLDSLDGLSDEREQKKYKEKINRIRKKIEEDKIIDNKGDFVGAGKAKGLSELLRILNSKINKTNLHLMIISQIRDKLGVVFGKKTERTGGKALNFYSSQIVWLYTVKKIEKSIIVDGNRYLRNTDVLVKAEVTKNKLGKAFRKCYFFTNPEIGIDNIKSNIYFLYGLITPLGEIKKGKKLLWDDAEFTVDKLIDFIEKNNLEKELEKKVIELWNKIEDSVIIKRKKKY